ncbi:ATP-binding protein [Moorellaceae bacterium AZ2]
MPGKLFPLGGPVPSEDIVDREDFLQSLENRLAEGQSIMLAGPRRIGKTSLAYEVLRRLKEKGFYTAAVDMFRLSGPRELAETLVNACLENATGLQKTTRTLRNGLRSIAGSAKVTVKLKDLALDLAFLEKEMEESRLLDYALAFPETLARKRGRRLVVLFDEFQDAARVAGEDVYKKMRSHFQNHQDVSYLFLGSKESLMEALFSDRGHAFYRFAVILPIAPISEEAWVEYITKKFESRGMSPNERAVREIIAKTGGHPQDTMLVCSEIYYALLEAGEKALSLEFVALGYERALLTLSPVFDEILDEIGHGPAMRKVLKDIATDKYIYSSKNFHPNEIKRAIDSLLARGIIERVGRGDYRFVEPMFRDYILKLLS